MGALAGRRRRIFVGSEKEVAKVEVHVPVGGVVHVDVEQAGTVVGMAELEAGLLACFASRRVPRRLPGVDVPAGLQPLVKPLVEVEHGAPGADHDGRPRDVAWTGLLVERPRQLVQAGLQLDLGPELSLVARLVVGDRPAHLVDQVVGTAPPVVRSARDHNPHPYHSRLPRSLSDVPQREGGE
jgi:hypothetical protein